MHDAVEEIFKLLKPLSYGRCKMREIMSNFEAGSKFGSPKIVHSP